jgi:oligopeptide/dipeptide ABC transporter ATP-binding protein
LSIKSRLSGNGAVAQQAKGGGPMESKHVMAASDELLKLTGLHVKIGHAPELVYPLQGIDLAVKRDSIVGLVGESGSGKSMTAMSILRLLPEGGRVTSGEVLFDEKDLLQISDGEMDEIRGSQITMVFQSAHNSLNPVLPVGNQISHVYRLHEGGSQRHAQRVAVEVLDGMGIPDAAQKAKDFPHQYSGGMAQRAMIAMALVCSPQLLIADEPTSGLDVTIQAQVLDLIVEHVRRRHASLLLISHDIGVIAETCEEVAVMYAGTILEYGTVGQVVHNPANPYTVGLMAAFLVEDGDRMHFIGGQVPQLTEFRTECPFAERCGEATEICHRERPALRKIDGDRRVACHHPLV